VDECKPLPAAPTRSMTAALRSHSPSRSVASTVVAQFPPRASDKIFG